MGLVLRGNDNAFAAIDQAETAWLLAGAVALGLLALIVTEQSLADAERLFRCTDRSAWCWQSEHSRR